jgi:hypothetical protein
MVAAGQPALRVVAGGVAPTPLPTLKLGPDGRQLRACGAIRVFEFERPIRRRSRAAVGRGEGAGCYS